MRFTACRFACCAGDRGLLRVLWTAERESQKTGIDGLCVFKPKGICTEIR